jgi:molecular chaperone DnaJ
MPSSTARDYYEVLGVGRDATAPEIKRAYRRLARRYHPDVNAQGAASEQFRELQEAYEVLSDPDKRRRYDRFGASAFQGAAAPGGLGFEISFDAARSWGKSLSELFGELFTGTARERKPTRGKDVQYTMDLSFEDALRGVSATIRLQKDARCARCQGHGFLPSQHEVECPDCRGRGKEDLGRGPFRFARDCQRCGGRGKIAEERCEACRGIGLHPTEEQITVRIPPGVDDGSKVRLPGKGDPGLFGGEPGDLFVLTRVQPHPFFVRKNYNLYCEVPVTFAEAALGARIPVPTIDGIASMKVPPGTQSGQVFRMREKGVPQVDGSGRGDQFVTVRVAVPPLLDEDSKAQLRALFQRIEHEPRKELYEQLERTAERRSPTVRRP